MARRYDFKKEWPRIKKELNHMSAEALKLVKKGEEEVVRYSQIGKLHLDAAALNLKKEHLYHLVGKEYVLADSPSTPTAKLQKYLNELKKIEKDIKELKNQAADKAQKRKIVARKKIKVKEGQTDNKKEIPESSEPRQEM